MIGKTYCIDNSDLIKTFTEKIHTAKERIKEFPILDSIFNNFKSYEIEINSKGRLPNNVVLNLLMSSNYKTVYTQNHLQQNEGTYFELKQLEYGLNSFFKNIFNTKQYNEFKNRFISSDNFTSIEAFTEIMVGYQISQSSQNIVDLYHELPNGKKPDLIINLSEKKVFLELTGLNVRKPQTKIDEITDNFSKYILLKCKKKGFILSINFDSFCLPKNSKNHIDKKLSISFLKHFIDSIYLEELIGFEGTINFRDHFISILQREQKSNISNNHDNEIILYVNKDYNENRNLFNSLQIDEKISESISKLSYYPILEQWSKTVKLADFLNSPFQSIEFQSSNINNGCVNIYSIETNTNDSALQGSSFFDTAEVMKNAFLKQIERTIDEKMKIGQYEEGSPFIIAIKAQEWRFQYEFDYEEFIPVRNNVQTILKKYKNVSGIILFTHNIFYGKYIQNNNSLEDIIVTQDELETANILFQHHEPMLKNDKSIDFSKLDYKTKTERIKKLLDIEPKINLYKDNIFHPYAKSDLIKLLTTIRQFLYESIIDQLLLNNIDSLVKKYCIINNPTENNSTIRNDPFCDNGIWKLGNVPLRAYAGRCQVLLTKNNPTNTNLLLTISLSNDSNSYVREGICQQLHNLYEVFPNETITIAEKYCNDYEYVRYYLRNFLKFLADKDRNKALNLFRIILKRYGKINYPHGHADESSLINYVVTFIMESFLLKEQKEYKELFDELINNRNYSEHIKKEIIYTIRQEKFISNPIILDQTIEICLKLLREGSNKVKEDVEFFFLHNLIHTNTSLYPKIKKLLDEICKIKYPEPILYLNNDLHFTILYYLEKFYSEFPNEAAKYLITILNLNEFLYNSFRITTIINILEKLLNNNINPANRNCLIIILKKIAKIDRRALNVMERLNIEP